MPKGIVKYNRLRNMPGMVSNAEGDTGGGGGTPSPAAPANPTEEQPQEPATGDEQLGDAGKKALEAERRKAREAAKERDTLAARLKEFEDRDKSDSEKAAERLTAAEKRAADAEARATRLDVAFEKGLTPAQAKRLVGNTREELEADADEILRDFPAAPATPGRPQGDIGQGARPPAQITDPRARDLAQIEADLKAGARR